MAVGFAQRKRSPSPSASRRAPADTDSLTRPRRCRSCRLSELRSSPIAEDPRDWEVETRLVRGGMARTAYGEISEALFLNQSFAYASAAAANARFAGDDPGFIYQRFGNPTTQVFEDRLALLE